MIESFIERGLGDWRQRPLIRVEFKSRNSVVRGAREVNKMMALRGERNGGQR